ncbi:unnamed protein product, partial [Ectocarpus sp. 12 AP-2014]
GPVYHRVGICRFSVVPFPRCTSLLETFSRQAARQLVQFLTPCAPRPAISRSCLCLPGSRASQSKGGRLQSRKGRLAVGDHPPLTMLLRKRGQHSIKSGMRNMSTPRTP